LSLKAILALALLVNVSVQPGRSADSPRPSARGVPVPANAALPQCPKPAPVALSSDAPSVHCDKLELIQSTNELGGFEVRVDGSRVAIGQTHPMIGYVVGEELRWLDLAEATQRKVSVSKQRDSLSVEEGCVDKDGGKWVVHQQFTPATSGSSLDIAVTFTCDHERSVAFLPMFVIFPGAGSFASVKGQGLLAGLEYLENEPSSSEADVIGPAANRRVPDNLKLTFPLMAIQNDHRFVALAWQMRPHFCALFDSPDRVFGSDGHLMGILFPGSDGKNRTEGSLLPKVTETRAAGESVVLQATLMGGRGDSVVPAIRQYVALRPLPPLPVTLDFQKYVSTAAGGWLDSKIREGALFRHAVADGGFPAGHAADAAVWMDWLARRTDQTNLAARLEAASKEALAGIAPADIDAAGVGHVRYPVASLVYGHVAEAAARAEQKGRALLARFESDLSVKYHPQPGGPDYAKTHSSNEANGFTSRPVIDLLEAAAFSGNPELVEAAVARLRAMDKFHNGVPRGAQTWECPLHIPDILASAQMVRAYTLGYELSNGDGALLEEARYWAWTGVPFVYLVNPTSQPVGLSGTIAVFGATQWRAPVWLGLPVQWCGLVYSDALYRLARHDPDGPWKRLADGIAASGVQQTWPTTDKDLQGLLPDSFVLRAQHRNGPAINPGTLLASASRFYSQTPVYDFCIPRTTGLRIHAPGPITRARTLTDPWHLSFEVESWVNGPYWVLINGLLGKPVLKINDQATKLTAPHQFQEKEGRLILRLEGKTRVALELVR
jgi:hypothetical protein